MAKVDYEETSRMLLKATRCGISQVELSRRLGFNYNKISRLESGTRPIYWDDYQRVCIQMGCQLGALSRRILGIDVSKFSGATLISRLTQSRDSKRLSPDIQKRLHNLSYEKAKFRLSDFLMLVDTIGELEPLLRNLVAPHKLPNSEAAFWDHFFDPAATTKELLSRDPIIEAYYAFLHIYNVSSVPSQIGKKLSLSVDQENQILENLKAAGLAEEKRGVTTAIAGVGLNTGGAGVDDYLNGLKIKEFWLRKALSIIEKRFLMPNVAVFGYHVLPISESSYTKVREIMASSFREIKKIADSDTNARKVVLLQMNLLDIDDTYQEKPR